ncbi:hypothetical protein [Pseudomonas sp. 24 E 13]|uniref:Trypsin-co-occurring domain-containing protein n=1 Tax=Pseudomonas synxantha TaxID=47883 RepID=A0A5D3G4L3_9PSED|nr:MULTISPECIES: trypco2 family protein [Pseudomonas]TYK55050.1 hypothetical protein FXO26_24840 [Pseudomonas synxantha]WET09438.1 hypothetical protein P3S72_23560 [Pseudomonas sp. D3]CRM12579.1 hypothetical protein [Pseudomonas sp. 24 E 13]
MKGNISLSDFIKEVKAELIESIDNDTPFFEMGEVQLEVSFSLDASAKAGAKLLVLDIGGSTKATQTHKVTIKLHPFVYADADEEMHPITIPDKVTPTALKGRSTNTFTVSLPRGTVVKEAPKFVNKEAPRAKKSGPSKSSPTATGKKSTHKGPK